MRSEQEIFELLLNIAKADERIRAVLLVGSRANPKIKKDKYQDYDIVYYVKDIKPFYNNPSWVIEKFGEPLIMQMLEAIRSPLGDGNFNYMMIYQDGVRIDLSFKFNKYMDTGEPAVILLDKDNGKGYLPSNLNVNNNYWDIKSPTALYYYSCCNNFWWCLNNVAKGIVRDELPYVMNMLNCVVREELHHMINYYIGIKHGYNISTGKYGKYFKYYLDDNLYKEYTATYLNSNNAEIWKAVEVMCDLFHKLAQEIANHFDFSYNQREEDGIRKYIKMVKYNL